MIMIMIIITIIIIVVVVWYFPDLHLQTSRRVQTMQSILWPVHIHEHASHRYSISSADCSQSLNCPEMHAPVSMPSPPPAPAHLPDLLQLYHPSQPLHSSTDTCLIPQLPPCRYKMKGGRALPHLGPSVWNSLPVHVENAATINMFK